MALSRKRAEQLAQAMAEAKAAKVRRDELIAAALKAGASTREVAAVIGLSPVQVFNIGKAHGWPTEAQRAVRDQRDADNRAWRKYIDDAAAKYLSEQEPLADEDT